MSSLLSVAYISFADTYLTKAELATIIDQSARNNLHDGITGMLILHDHQFMQVLEGPEDKVKALMVKLRRDTRHDSLYELFRRPIAEREFPDWSMALCDSADLPLESRSALNGFLSDVRTPPTPLDTAGIGAALLEQFRKDMLERKPC